MKYNDIITVSRTDVGFVSSHRNVEFTIRSRTIWPGPRERVKNTHNARMSYNFFRIPLLLSPSLFLSLSHSFSV